MPGKSILKKPSTAPRPDRGVPIAVRIRPDKLAQLDAFATDKGVSRAAAIQLAISEFVDRYGK